MATECDVLISHSQPGFCHSHSSSTGFYGNCRFQNRRSENNRSPLPLVKSPAYTSSSVSRHVSPSRRHGSPMRSGSQERKPRRPCLVTRIDDSSSSGSSSGDENEPTTPTRQKKKVVFADDRGLCLTQVRMMVENSCEIQNFNFSEIRRQLYNFGIPNTKLLSNAEISKNSIPTSLNGDNWKTKFSQPASNYLDFRRRLDEENISLENVIIKQNSSDKEVFGTIKVKNICFEKSVFIRASVNNWATHEDINCHFVENQSNNQSINIPIIYDTFSFKLILPINEKFIEFCVCFRAVDHEFWDNNNGQNYWIEKYEGPRQIETTTTINSTGASEKLSQKMSILGFRSHTWPEFVHTNYEQQYW